MRKISRRSFLARVAGAAVLAGGAFTAGWSQAARTGRTDRDQVDRPGHGRRPRGGADDDEGPSADPFRPPARPPRTQRRYTGGTDTDPNFGGDIAGSGRTGLTDSDPTDWANYGLGPRSGPCPPGFERYGIDADAGPNGDPSGRCVIRKPHGRR